MRLGTRTYENFESERCVHKLSRCPLKAIKKMMDVMISTFPKFLRLTNVYIGLSRFKDVISCSTDGFKVMRVLVKTFVCETAPRLHAFTLFFFFNAATEYERT